MKKVGYTVGVGRHSEAEIQEMVKHDLRQLSNILGDYACVRDFVCFCLVFVHFVSISVRLIRMFFFV